MAQVGRLGPKVGSRDAPKFGLGRTSAEYSAEGFGSVRFGHASSFGRTSVLFGLGCAPRSAHFIACVQSMYTPRISVFRRSNKFTFTEPKPLAEHSADVRSKPNFDAPLIHMLNVDAFELLQTKHDVDC